MPNIGAAYFWLCLVKGGRELQRHAIDDWMEEGQRSLAVLDKRLSTSRFVAGERYTDRRHRALCLYACGA